MRRLVRSSRLAIVIVMLVMSVVPTSWASAKPPPTRDVQSAQHPWLREKTLRSVVPVRNARMATVAQLATDPAVGLAPCDDDPAWLCGSIRVPIDRADRGGRTISIGFRVLPHSNPASTARDALMVSSGGPGIATGQDRGLFQFIFDPILADRDLLLVDNRGTGSSNPIDCPDLQRGVFDHDAVIAAVGACGAQLGPDADRYGSGDVALDVEDIRRALGYPQLSYFGPSYGSVDAQAYAVRFPKRLRAIVIDAGLPVTDRAHAWAWGLDIPGAFARNTALACLRAPACAAAQPDARTALADLARAVRKDPVDGVARDRYGNLRRVHIDEDQIVNIVTSDILNPGELAAASAALAVGDEKPLLRLGAELFFEPGEPDDPAFYSAGDNAAAFCNDADFVWDRQDSRQVRVAKYGRALHDLGRDRFAPLTNAAWTNYWIPDFCTLWPAPDRFTPAVPRGATVTGIPTLLIGGDRDINVASATTHRLLGLFPQATFVEAAGTLHLPTGWSECARLIAQTFIATLRTGDTGCARDPAFVPLAFPEFPRTAGEATPATALPGNASTVADRRVATMSVRAVLDSIDRSFRIPGATGTGYGLRGGTFDFSFETGEDVLQLHASRFARDVAVDGTATLSFEGNEVHMELTVTGPGGHSGTLTADGAFGFAAPFRDFVVTGVIGGRAVVVSVPAN